MFDIEERRRTVGARRLVIKAFANIVNRLWGDSGGTPEHLESRWNGLNNRWYRRVWNALDGDRDEFLFDDYCDVCMKVKEGDTSSLEALGGRRLVRLFRFAAAMLGHYLLVTAVWESVGFGIKYVAHPLFSMFVAARRLVDELLERARGSRGD